MKHVAEVNEPLELPRLRRAHRPAVVHRIVAQHAHRHPPDPREARHLRPPVVAVQLKERAAVHDQTDQLAWIVAAVAVARNQRDQRLLPAVDRVVGLGDRRRLMHVRRQIREKRPNLPHQIRLIRRVVIHHSAAARMHLVAAQLLLADLLAQRALDQRRPAREHLRRTPHHHREMTRRHLRRRQPSHRAERRRHHRHLRHQLPPAGWPVHLRQIGAPHLRRRPDVRPEAVDQPDQRQLQLQRHPLRLARFVAAPAMHPQLAPLNLRAAL